MTHGQGRGSTFFIFWLYWNEFSPQSSPLKMSRHKWGVRVYGTKSHGGGGCTGGSKMAKSVTNMFYHCFCRRRNELQNFLSSVFCESICFELHSPLLVRSCSRVVWTDSDSFSVHFPDADRRIGATEVQFGWCHLWKLKHIKSSFN